MLDDVRFEPTTFRLQSGRSTTGANRPMYNSDIPIYKIVISLSKILIFSNPFSDAIIRYVIFDTNLNIGT